MNNELKKDAQPNRGEREKKKEEPENQMRRNYRNAHL